jgi:hypothetical protein
MTTASRGKGADKNITFKSVNDITYKGLVLENYNATKSIIIAAAQDRFAKDKVTSCYLAVNSLANMILPFVADDPYKPYVMTLKEGIVLNLKELKDQYDDVWTMGITERANYVSKCESVLSSLPPLFSFIGLYVRTTVKGIFKYPDKEDEND